MYMWQVFTSSSQAGISWHNYWFECVFVSPRAQLQVCIHRYRWQVAQYIVVNRRRRSGYKCRALDRRTQTKETRDTDPWTPTAKSITPLCTHEHWVTRPGLGHQYNLAVVVIAILTVNVTLSVMHSEILKGSYTVTHYRLCTYIN